MNFLPTLPVFAAYLAAVLIIVFTPGPDMTLFLGKAVRQGTAAGIAAMLGASVGILIHTTLVALGLSALLAASATAFTILKVVGALYLLWLAIQAVRHGSALNIDANKPLGAGEPLYRTWLMGLGVNLLNPKIIMFFVTFLPQFVTAGDPHAPQKLVFLGVMLVVVAVPISVVMIIFAARLASLLKRTPRVMRAIDWLFAGIFSAFAVRLLFTRSH
jgi:threonine/homoserine/homoserine lactone efflux protein